MRMQAAEVRQDRADEAAVETERAAEATGTSEAVSTAGVRSERAGAVSPSRLASRAASTAPDASRTRPLENSSAPLSSSRPEASRVSSAEPQGSVLASSTAEGQRARAVSAEARAAVRARPPEAPKKTAVAPSGARLTSAAAPAPRLASGARPEGERLALAQPETPIVTSDGIATDLTAPIEVEPPSTPPAEPEVAALSPDAAPSVSAPQAPAAGQPASLSETRGQPATGPAAASLASQPGTRPASDIAVAARAGLAWSGGSDARFDALSLATVQSFMAPKQTSDAADGDVRDGLGQLLSEYPCSRMEAAFVPETGTMAIRGHVPDAGLRTAVEERLRAMIGTAIGVGNDLQVLPQPLCGILDGVEALGLPQSTDQTDDPLVVGRSAQAKIEQFSDGDAFGLDLGGADYDAYVYVDYYDRAGNVFHLIPNEHVPLRRQSAKSALRIGQGNPEFDPLGMRISAPFGRDVVVAFAASSPVYEGLRPIVEPAAEYLQWLRERIGEARRSHGVKGEWVYLFVDTAALP